MPTLPEPPRPEPRPVVDERFGHRRVDEYAWLRDREDPGTLPHLEDSNAHTEAWMEQHTGELREGLYKEMRGRIKEADTSVPVLEHGYYYYSRTEEGDEYPRHCRKKGSLDADEEIYLDETVLAEGHDYFALSSFAVSRDHRYVAYAVDLSGDEIHEIVIKDLETGVLLPERIGGAGTSLVWANDCATLFYSLLDPQHRPYRAMRHQRATAVEDDVLIYEETDEAFFLGLYRTRTDAFVVLALGSQVTSEVRVISADTPHEEPRIITPRRQGVEYGIAHDGDRFLIHTNDRATNFRLLEAPIDDPGLDHWREVIAHRDDVLLEDVDAFSGHLVLWEKEAGLRRLRIMPKADPASEHRVDFPDPAYTVWGSSNPTYETTTLRFGYASMTTPSSVFDYGLDDRSRTLLKRQEIVGGHDPDAYRCERIWATASDGAKVPISLVYRVEGPARPRPLLLYGYGAYGHAIEPGFSSSRLSLLDRGAIWAIAHVRGGDDLGRAWYDNGKLAHKKNTFTDFIACADHLVREGYTAADRLAASGGSAGGMLMGAITNMRPELFRVIVADVPFVDCLNTMLDSTLPLTVVEYEEWGNPNEREAFETILAYSPYENVIAQAYPEMLVLAGLNDPRVGYWEPAKWAARLRERRTDDGTLLLWTQMGAGHAGASGRFEYLREVALKYAFVLDRLGIKDGRSAGLPAAPGPEGGGESAARNSSPRVRGSPVSGDSLGVVSGAALLRAEPGDASDTGAESHPRRSERIAAAAEAGTFTP